MNTPTFEQMTTTEQRRVDTAASASGPSPQSSAHSANHIEHPTELNGSLFNLFSRTTALFSGNGELLLAAITLIFLLMGWIGGSLTGWLPLWAVVGCAVVAYVAGGYTGFNEAVAEFRNGKLDIDFLMIAAAVGAALIGEWEEGALLLFLFTLSGALEEFAMDRTRHAIEALTDLRPDTAQRLRGDIEETIAVADLHIDERVLVRPGDRIPVDGRVVAGTSSVDQSPITGESIPVGKEAGDEVFAGTINGGGSMEVSVTKPAEQSTLNKIIQLVEDAQEDAVPAQRFIDRFSQPYTLFVIGLTIAAIILPQLFSAESFSQTFYRAMTLLVVASPCALVISTPASILSAIAAAAREGLLFKGGIHLENLSQVSVAAFDKTGTLTKGHPTVTDVLPLKESSADQVLQIAASAEAHSEHHLARAIVQKAAEKNVPLLKPIEFEAIAGKGVRALLTMQEKQAEDSSPEKAVLVGNDKLFETLQIPLADDTIQAGRTLQRQGKTAVLVAVRSGTQKADSNKNAQAENWTPIGFIGVADTLREDAKANVQSLRDQGVQHIAMLTGDNQDVAEAIANELGLDQVYSELLPEEKVDVLMRLQAKGSTVMVGDGINDAPALAIADVGVAMGASGTDAALETADVVLMGDRLSRLPFAIRLGKQAQRTVKQNVAFSIGVMLVLMAVTVLLPLIRPGFQLPLPLGVIGHEGSTLLVVANGLRLLGLRPDESPSI